MRQFTTILFILTFWTVSNGQTRKLTGQIYMGENETAFPKILVVLYKNSQIVKKTWANERGTFKIDSIDNGVYELTLKQLGAFNTKLTNVTVKDTLTNLGIIPMHWIEYRDGGIDMVSIKAKSKKRQTITQKDINGNLKYIIEINNKMRNGISRQYYYGLGIVYYEQEFKDDKRQGIYREYYKSGTLKIQGNYDNGLRSGQWNYYDENGELTLCSKFDSVDNYEIYDSRILTGELACR
jgi:antitoxin component YwqK of YwqJK toxin-antitoxin module